MIKTWCPSPHLARWEFPQYFSCEPDSWISSVGIIARQTPEEDFDACSVWTFIVRAQHFVHLGILRAASSNGRRWQRQP